MEKLLLNILIEFWLVLGELSPYLLFGFLFAGILYVLISPETVKKHLGKDKTSSVFKASILGVPLPLCSCSVIPVATSLKKSGASRGATTSFLISTPQTGVDSIIVTYGVLGPVFAIVRPIVAFISGIIGGMLVDTFAPENSSIEENNSTNNINSCCEKHANSNKFLQAMHHGFVTIPKDIGGSLFVGVFAASLISAIVPDDFFVQHLSSGIGTMFIIVLLSIPIYVCSTSSVPIAAALILKGLSPGAALVFLIAGPASNAATLSTLWTILGKKVTFIYLFTMIVTAIGAGLLIDQLLDIVTTSQMIEHRMWMLPKVVNNTSAIVLLLILAYCQIEKKIAVNKVPEKITKEEHSCCSKHDHH